MSKKILVVERESITGLKCPNQHMHEEKIIDNYMKGFSDEEIEKIKSVVFGNRKMSDIKYDNPKQEKKNRSFCESLIKIKTEMSGMYVDGPNAVCGICFASVNVVMEAIEILDKLSLETCKIRKNLIKEYEYWRGALMSSVVMKEYFLRCFCTKMIPVGICVKDRCSGTLLIKDKGNLIICNKCLKVFVGSRFYELKTNLGSLVYPIAKKKIPERILEKEMI